jgi:hypothetical protein
MTDSKGELMYPYLYDVKLPITSFSYQLCKLLQESSIHFVEALYHSTIDIDDAYKSSLLIAIFADRSLYWHHDLTPALGITCNVPRE